MKREKSFTYSVRLPPAYEKVLNQGRKYLHEHPDLVNKIGKLIFVSDVFRYALDVLADTLEMDFKNEEEEEIIITENEREMLKERHEDERDLAKILAGKYFALQDEFIHEFQGKMTLFEFCDLKGIDWVSLLRDDRTNK